MQDQNLPSCLSLPPGGSEIRSFTVSIPLAQQLPGMRGIRAPNLPLLGIFLPPGSIPISGTLLISLLPLTLLESFCLQSSCDMSGRGRHGEPHGTSLTEARPSLHLWGPSVPDEPSVKVGHSMNTWQAESQLGKMPPPASRPAVGRMPRG